MMREKWPLGHLDGGGSTFRAEGKSKHMASEMGMENSGVQGGS